MLNILKNSIHSNSLVLGDEIMLVKKTNLMQILEILNKEQRIQLLSIFGLSKPDFKRLDESSQWANEAMLSLNIKCKELAIDASVSPCDVSYLLNKDERLSGTGRREKIINKLYEKLEQKFSSELFSKSS